MSEQRNERANILLGELLVLNGLLFNVWVLTALFSPGGELGALEKTIIWTVDGLFILSGLLIIVFRKNLDFSNLAILAVTLILCLVAAEAYLRLTDKERPVFEVAMENPNRTGSFRL